MYQQKEEKVTFELKLADNFRSFFDEETKKLTPQFQSFKVKSLFLVDKQLDNPLPWFKKFVAKIVRLSTKHEFIIFKLDEIDIVGSIDFYNNNTVVFRIGNNQTVLEGDNTGKREKFEVLKEEKSAVMFEGEENYVTLGELMKIAHKYVPKNGYNQFDYNCSHFSRDILKEVKKARKNREKLMKKSNFVTQISFSLE